MKKTFYNIFGLLKGSKGDNKWEKTLKIDFESESEAISELERLQKGLRTKQGITIADINVFSQYEDLEVRPTNTIEITEREGDDPSIMN